MKSPPTGARAKSRSPTRGDREADPERRAEAEAHDEPRGHEHRQEHHHEVARQEREADLERAVAQHELQVQRREEEPGEHRRRPEHADDVRDGDVALAEEAERHERRPGASLDRDERGEEHACEAKQSERLERGPAVVVAVDDRVDGEHQRERHGDGAGDVELHVGGGPALGGQQAHRRHDDRDADRQVDEEDPVPVERVREDAAEHDADAPAAGRDEADDAHRLRSLGGLCEERHDERQRDDRDDRAAEPLDRAGGDEELLRLGDAARERRHREDHEADEEELAMAEEVAEPPAEQQEAAERQQVGVHDPGK